MKNLTHPFASAMLFPSLRVERGEDRFIGLGVSKHKMRHYILSIT